jgi:serine/threonine protein kinase
MGVVHEALHMTLGRRIAVKTLLGETGDDPQLAARFEREARAASAIGHPHIVDVFDLGRTPEGLLFMAMELLDGQPLAALLAKTPRLPLPLAIDLISQVLSGLAAAHKNGIVHRDLKPDNIFILNTEDRPNFVKIVDFGISKMLLGAAPGQAAAGGGTVVGTVMGTPLYMSPEQVLGQVALIDHRTDIYSAGVVLYEMLCGRTPFEDETPAQIFAHILDGRYFLPRGLRPEIPPAVESAIVRALDRNMENRFPTAAAMREAVTGREADLTPPPEPVSALFGRPLQLAPGPEAGDGSPLFSPQAGSEARRISSGIHAPRDAAGAERFAPPPDQAVVPLLADDRGPTLTARTSAAEIPIDRSERSRPRPGSASQVMAPDRTPSPLNRSRIVKALGLLALLIVAGFAYSHLRTTRGRDAPAKQRTQCQVTLAVQPSEAIVQVDHLPVMRDDLLLDQDASHVLHAAAPGRITRSFSFKAKPGLELSVHLGRTLPLPSSTDPEPSRTELATSYPKDPASGEEINRVFAKLDRYAACLALLVHADGDARKAANRAGPSGGEIGRCIQLLQEAATLQPEMFQLHGAGAAYLQGVAGAQGSSAPHRLLATFRSEFFAAQTGWQMEELARQETDEGQTAAWHMRRVALAAQAWLRQGKAPLALGRGSTDRRAKLDEAHQAFLEFAQHSPREMAQVSGADEFMKAAQNVVTLAHGQTGKRQDASAALAACRQLFTAFNALVVE